tara:strand:+ start:4697 stop:5407 length:711 start_codon:yes stop_codon:yes gene_type:complete
MNEEINPKYESTQKREWGDSNLELWEAVCKTNPNTTKSVSMRGGFTAVCPQSQIKNATAIFGLYGDGWGVDFQREEYVRDAAGSVIEYVYRGRLWYKWKGRKGEIACSASMKYKAGDDVQMKCETHARSKALSKLGFNSDVYEGLFDNVEYVETVNREMNGNPDTRVMPAEIEEYSEALKNLRQTCKENKLPTDKVKSHMAQWFEDYDVESMEELSAHQLNECAFEIHQTYNEGDK